MHSREKFLAAGSGMEPAKSAGRKMFSGGRKTSGCAKGYIYSTIVDGMIIYRHLLRSDIGGIT